MAEVSSSFRDLDPEEARQLVAAGKVRLLDVRTVEEYRDGHLPGSILLPIDRITSAPGVLDQEGLPLLVYCELNVTVMIWVMDGVHTPPAVAPLLSQRNMG